MSYKKNWKVVLSMTAVLVSLTCGQVFASIAPSVEQKPAPTLVGAATFTDASGKEIAINPSDIKIIADGSTATLTPEQKVVYDQAKAALTAPDSQYGKDLNSFLTENYPGINSENVIVREIFDINVGQDLVFGEGQKLELTLGGKYNRADTIIVTVFNKDTGKWDFVAVDDVVINKDGSITVKFPHLCPVAILVAGGSDTMATTTVDGVRKNAQVAATGGITMIDGNVNNGPSLMAIVGTAASVFGIALVGFIVIKKKESKQSE